MFGFLRRPDLDDFRCGLAGDRPVHLVLHGFEELNADFQGGIVVDACGVNIRDFLVEASLGCADILDPAGQFLEVIEGQIRVFEPLVIKDNP